MSAVPHAVLGVVALVLAASAQQAIAGPLVYVEVGAGTFWQGMVDYVSGVPLQTVLFEIERGYSQVPAADDVPDAGP